MLFKKKAKASSPTFFFLLAGMWSRCLKFEHPPWTIRSMSCVREGKTKRWKEFLSLMMVKVLYQLCTWFL